jgi:hypothetical protein
VAGAYFRGILAVTRRAIWDASVPSPTFTSVWRIATGSPDSRRRVLR